MVSPLSNEMLRLCSRGVTSSTVIVWASLLLLSVAAAARTLPAGTPASRSLYEARLGSTCPQKHLELLASADRLEGTDGFRDILAPHERALVDRLAGIHGRNAGSRFCRHVEGDVASCEAIVALNAIRKAGLVDRYVRRLCVSFKRCESLGMCETDPQGKGTLIHFSNDGREFGLPPLPPALSSAH